MVGALPVILKALEEENAFVRGQLLKILHSILYHHGDVQSIGSKDKKALLSTLNTIAKTDQRAGVKHTSNLIISLLLS